VNGPLTLLERGTRVALGMATAVVLSSAVVAMLRGLGRTAGRTTGSLAIVNAPALVGGSVAFVAGGRALWRPLPVPERPILRWLGLIVGARLLLGGLVLYHLGRQTLGPMYQASSGLGVRLYADHRLVTTGIYAVIRHPMYAGVVLGCLGALLLYRTWATVAALVLIPAVVLRARREDTALEAEFGSAWRAYRASVPGWFPTLPARATQRGHS
jgi:protein-S-isoprenylcysteine O-methyltransferase Ste14